MILVGHHALDQSVVLGAFGQLLGKERRGQLVALWRLAGRK